MALFWCHLGVMNPPVSVFSARFLKRGDLLFMAAVLAYGPHFWRCSRNKNTPDSATLTAFIGEVAQNMKLYFGNDSLF